MKNSTILVKKKTCVNCGRIDYWFSKKMCKQCATIHSTQKRMKEFENEKDDDSLSNLIEDLDLVFSRYIRIKYTNSDGFCECYTCGKVDRYINLQCGHYIPRANLSTRFLEQNCRPQCKTCNEYKSGNLNEFTNNLKKEQLGILDWLLETSKQISKPTRDEVKQLLIQYRYKFNILTKKLK